ncbi:hypothetical protein HRR81_004650 [Exophiala dermatitidis]|uniref:Lysine-specific metallo-endopeptidase domain-containing protein n=2 Tax=Exophiala dermatitidis TaxID=5970 RepID=H6BT60_EXODN|nr:uncharacterized protein HMPREF1120_02480 [Exophiala dermatitidis NIH/UT8656]KAJ4503357.1 hypothetical protein HRR75_008140 [Exophiala dermatitidis]EHY54310.1 hypothetical protein HMPREF1120_02480 [Exophiala dermatitidis NIH/UT8656]KAJ4535681.1 hypothetical protein HRR77_007629 [Exophiala dermatitidis]KAJ4541797.1 hypothetical protein HRR78_007075 [Exophiala dermatitidis]KAJ4561395.1 hypothetical protein HRR79_007227 [Exophiala dermatitidis]
MAKTAGCRRLQLLLVFFMSFMTLSSANLPQLVVPLHTSLQDPGPKLQQAFKDSVMLARVVALTFDPCEEVFLRYFTAEEADFVKHAFRTLANVPLDVMINEETDIGGLLGAPTSPGTLQPKFANLDIALGDHPDIPAADRLYGHLSEDGLLFDAYTYLDVDEFELSDEASQVDMISLCEQLFQFPSLDEIEHPPNEPWARDAQGNPLPGFTCNGLGNTDSDWMVSPGATLLHELMHWSYLFKDIPGFSGLIRQDEAGLPQIRDFSQPNSNPPDGMGAYHARLLRDLGPYTAIQNADSYRWYALSKYWTWKCKRGFAAATSDLDVYKRGPRTSASQPEMAAAGEEASGTGQ